MFHTWRKKNEFQKCVFFFSPDTFQMFLHPSIDRKYTWRNHITSQLTSLCITTIEIICNWESIILENITPQMQNILDKDMYSTYACNAIWGFLGTGCYCPLSAYFYFYFRVLKRERTQENTRVRELLHTVAAASCFDNGHGDCMYATS